MLPCYPTTHAPNSRPPSDRGRSPACEDGGLIVIAGRARVGDRQGPGQVVENIWVVGIAVGPQCLAPLVFIAWDCSSPHPSGSAWSASRSAPRPDGSTDPGGRRSDPDSPHGFVALAVPEPLRCC
jgi:hypothetical protein